ncbi:Uu.00g058830.m01.CDS01 [Anthostomella pinea]|uniref:Uu.00g058830.m01.CDS01 n=1 Tax=Anthostomella pinea TaxID=933095 RepID=A0AAI8VS04_9PEZI|nr:Uu.00g058830.m01.CDS01 [Anthostomella pinea]
MPGEGVYIPPHRRAVATDSSPTRSRHQLRADAPVYNPTASQHQLRADVQAVARTSPLSDEARAQAIRAAGPFEWETRMCIPEEIPETLRKTARYWRRPVSQSSAEVLAIVPMNVEDPEVREAICQAARELGITESGNGVLGELDRIQPLQLGPTPSSRVEDDLMDIVDRSELTPSCEELRATGMNVSAYRRNICKIRETLIEMGMPLRHQRTWAGVNDSGGGLRSLYPLLGPDPGLDAYIFRNGIMGTDAAFNPRSHTLVQMYGFGVVELEWLQRNPDHVERAEQWATLRRYHALQVWRGPVNCENIRETLRFAYRLRDSRHAMSQAERVPGWGEQLIRLRRLRRLRRLEFTVAELMVCRVWVEFVRWDGQLRFLGFQLRRLRNGLRSADWETLTYEEQRRLLGWPIIGDFVRRYEDLLTPAVDFYPFPGNGAGNWASGGGMPSIRFLEV